MKKQAPVPEFDVAYPPRPVRVTLSGGEQSPWQAAYDSAIRMQKNAEQIDASLRSLRESQGEERRKLVLQLVEDVVDNLDRSLAEAEQRQFDAATLRWVQKLQRTRRAIDKFLAREHVVPFDVVTAPVGTITIDGVDERDDVPDGTVTSVIVRGYLWQGELLRKATVRVAQNTQPDAAARPNRESARED
jgi:molecular chaperone GrpE (heat shock protein)